MNTGEQRMDLTFKTPCGRFNYRVGGRVAYDETTE